MTFCCSFKTVCLFSHENQIIKNFLFWLKLLFPKQHCAALKIFCQQLYKPEKSSKSSSFRSQRHKKLFTFLLEKHMKKKDMHTRKLQFKRNSSEKHVWGRVASLALEISHRRKKYSHSNGGFCCASLSFSILPRILQSSTHSTGHRDVQVFFIIHYIKIHQTFYGFIIIID